MFQSIHFATGGLQLSSRHISTIIKGMADDNLECHGKGSEYFCKLEISVIFCYLNTIIMLDVSVKRGQS